MIRILSIDGGGIKGIIPLTFLSALEKKLGNKPLVDKFHMVAGTSTGGILAIGMTSGLSLDKMTDMYLNRGQDIFSRGDSWYSSAFRWVTSAKGTLRSTYATGPMEEVFHELVGDKTQKDLSIPTLVASYDLKGMEPFFFQSWKAIDPEDPEKLNFKLEDIARATSAAPTFFDPKEVSEGGKDFVFIDGGVAANDPGTCAYAAARKIFKILHPLKEGETNRKPRGIQVLSLGTGAYSSELKPWNGGILSFGTGLITEVMLGGNVQISRYQMENIFRATTAVEEEGHINAGKRDYTRINPPIDKKLSAMDDYKNVKELQKVAQQYVESREGQLDLEKWAKFLEEDRVPLKELYFKKSLQDVATN